MSDWLKEMEDHSFRENLAAIRKEFHRGADAGDFPDTQESWVAFINGWQGTRKFQSAKHKLSNAGQGSYLGAMMCWLIGGMFLGFMVLSYFTFPAETLAFDRFPWITAGSLALIALGFVFFKRTRRTAVKAVQDHREKWGNPADEKGVDE